MRLFASAVIFSAMVTSSYAQSDPARVEFQPIPDTIPGLLIEPSPLSGTLLKPLTKGPAGQAPVEAAATGNSLPANPAPAVAPVAEVSDPAPLPEPAPQSAPAPAQAPAPTAVPAPTAAPAAPAAAPPPAKPAAPARAAKTTVTVIVEGVESARGVVNVAVCDKDLSEEGCPHSRSVKAAAGFVEARFDEVPPGVYAVVGYHDENGNDEFDKFLGVPREPYALSNRAGEKMVPTFRDAALNIKQGENTVIIRLQRLLGG